MRLTEDVNELLDICDALKYFEKCKINANDFLLYMKQGIYNKILFPYVKYKGDKLIGCVVFQLTRDLNPGKVLNGVWMYVDPHYPKLHIKIAHLADSVALDKFADRIIICTQRKAEAAERRLNKFGYIAKYTLFEKEVKVYGSE